MYKFGHNLTVFALLGLGFSQTLAIAQDASPTLRWPAKPSSVVSDKPFSGAQDHRPSSSDTDVFYASSPLTSGPSQDLTPVSIIAKPAETAIVEIDKPALAPQQIDQIPQSFQTLNPISGQSYVSVPYIPKGETVAQITPQTPLAMPKAESPKPTQPAPVTAVKPPPPAPVKAPPAQNQDPEAAALLMPSPSMDKPAMTPNEYRLPASSKYADRLDKDHVLLSKATMPPTPSAPLALSQTDDVFVPSEALQARAVAQTENTSPRTYSLHRQYGYQPDQITLPEGDNTGLLIPDLLDSRDNNLDDGVEDITPIIAASRARSEAAARSLKKGS